MSFSDFRVWTIVLLSVDMQNMIVNKFRYRSEAEECLRLLRRSNPNEKYEIMYTPPKKSPVASTEGQFINTGNDCAQVTDEGSKTMEIVWYRPDYMKPQEIVPVLGIYEIDGEFISENVCLGFSGVWWIGGYKSVDSPLWWTEIPFPTTE